MEISTQIQSKITLLKKESQFLSVLLNSFYFSLIGGGILLLTVGRKGRIGIYFIAYLVVFTMLGKIISTKYKQFYFKKGDLYLELEKIDKALLCFQKVSKIKGSKAEEAEYKIGFCFERLNNHHSAVGAYEKYLKKYPKGKWKTTIEDTLKDLRDQRKSTDKKGKKKGLKKSKKSTDNQTQATREIIQEKVRSSLTMLEIREIPSERFHRGMEIGDYVLIRKIGEGGFGEVWKSHHHFFQDRFVALKIPTHPDYIANLQKEGILQNSLKSPWIVRPENINMEGDPPYLAMEYVEGVDLEVLLRDHGAFSLLESLDIFSGILSALQVAHSQEVIHRDLKPANILIDLEGNIKLTDFELGKINVLTTSLSINESVDKGVKGTLLYMAPEQMKGRNVDVRADIYSLGVILFELLAHELPQPGDKISDFNSNTPEDLEHIFSHCYTRLNKRFSSIEEILEVFQKISEPTK